MAPANGTAAALLSMSNLLASIKTQMDSLITSQSREQEKDDHRTELLKENLRKAEEIYQTLKAHVAVSEGFIDEERSHHSDSQAGAHGVNAELIGIQQDLGTVIKMLDNKEKTRQIRASFLKWFFGAFGGGAGGTYGLPKLIEWLMS